MLETIASSPLDTASGSSYKLNHCDLVLLHQARSSAVGVPRSEPGGGNELVSFPPAEAVTEVQSHEEAVVLPTDIGGASQVVRRDDAVQAYARRIARETSKFHPLDDVRGNCEEVSGRRIIQLLRHVDEAIRG